jgi:hypothetical protein
MSDAKFTLVNHDTEQTFVEDSRADAEDRKQFGIDEFGFAEDDLDVVTGAFESYEDVEIEHATDGGEADVIESDAADDSQGAEWTPGDEGTPAATHADPTPAEADLPDDPSVSEDPIDWLPSHFIDTIQGVPAVNRKGYAVIASKYGVSVEAEPVTLPSETDFEYAEFRATATTAEGETYSGFGSAHVARMDGDDPYLLGELAETRALKRATAWATGVGMTAVTELQNDL